MASEIIKNMIIVGAGSFMGGAARYLISVAMKGMSKGFPWGTLLVNLVGCLLIGLLWGIFSKSSHANSAWVLFLTVGVCGGFTTFSTFSKEALTMLQCNNYLGFASYVGVSIIAGVSLTALGYILAR